MRIVCMLTSLGIGGAERLTLAIAVRMRERGHAVAVFTLRPHLEEEWPKDYPDLPKAFAKLRSSQPDAELWIAGQGTDGQLSALEALAAELHLLRGRDCLWCLPRPWRWKSRSSRPRPEAVRELVADAGVLMPTKDTERLAEAMRALRLMPVEARSARGRAARLRIGQSFWSDARAKDWESLYRVVRSPDSIR